LSTKNNPGVLIQLVEVHRTESSTIQANFDAADPSEEAGNAGQTAHRSKLATAA